MPSVIIKIKPTVKILGTADTFAVMRKIQPRLKFLKQSGAGDTEAPVVVYDPPSGTIFRSPVRVVKIICTDELEIVRVMVSVEFKNTGVWDTVFNGERFADRYKNSTVQVVSPTQTILNVQRFGGWGSNAVPRFETIVFDKGGNIAQ